MRIKPRILAYLAALGALVGPGASAVSAAERPADPPYQTVLPKVGLEKLIARSDAIIEAQVVERDARWVDGSIETTTRLQVVRDFKGDLGRTRGEVEVTQMGGKVEGIPIGQHVPGNAFLAPDERVILFLDTNIEGARAHLENVRAERGLPAPEYHPDSRLHTSPRIVGRFKGKFTILETPSGSRFVTRQSLVGTVIDDNSYRRVRDYQLSRLTDARAEIVAEREAAIKARSANANDSSASSPDARLFEAGRSEGVPDEKIAEMIQRRDAVTARQREAGLKITSETERSAAAASSSASAGAKSHERILIPYNQDALAVPVPLSTFESELARLVEVEQSQQ